MKLLASLLFPLLLFLGQAFLAPSSAPPTLAPALSTEEEIQQAELPWRDLRDLAVRVRGVPSEVATALPPPLPAERQVGDRSSFWVADEANDLYYTVDATLEAVTPHAYVYLADNTRVDPSRLQEVARVFEEKIYPEGRRYFGEEPEVGIDGDPHVSIVNASIPGLGGYFTSVDEYPVAVHPYSNERKAIYINVDSAPPGSSGYYGVLAHEFEHMIHSRTNKFEQTWIKEGAAEVATEAADLGSSGTVRAFEARPDTQLDAWADSSGDVAAHYGAAYLFLSYFLEHFGGYEAGADLLTGETRGIETFDSYLSRHGYGESFDDVFKNWVVANYLDGTAVQDPWYQYEKLRVRVPTTERINSSTGWQDRSVRQLAADYLELGGRWSKAKISFQGDPTNRVVPTEAHSGSDFWWSNRGDMVDTTLTHVFDLRGLTEATLNFWAWYDLEVDYDYAYVLVSRDGGLTWSPLATADTSDSNPNGNSLGPGFTGKSGGGDSAQWVAQSVDLSPYVGEEVLIRFEQVTDDAFNAPGFAVDDLSIPEVDYTSEAEDDGGWVPVGFVRSDGVLAQPFSLQLIRFGNTIAVEQIPLLPGESADVLLDNTDGQLDRAVLVVSALGRYTTEPARYRYNVELSP